MNKSLIYIVGGTVLVGGAYLFLKNKKAKDLAKLDELGGTTSGGTTSGGTTPSLSNTSDGVAPSDANINLANATILVAEIKAIDKEYNTAFRGEKYVKHSGFITTQRTPEYNAYTLMRATYKQRREAKVSELAKLGYKVDATGTLVKI